MTNDADGYAALREISKARRARNREHGPELLRAAGIAFESHNGGAHLTISRGAEVIDYWPGTGYWRVRSTRETNRGVRKLIARVTREAAT